jgi:hypothetical protein
LSFILAPAPGQGRWVSQNKGISGNEKHTHQYQIRPKTIIDRPIDLSPTLMKSLNFRNSHRHKVPVDD